MAFERTITVKLTEGPNAGKSYPCKEDVPGWSSVLVDSPEVHCHVCRDRVALVDFRGVTRALSRQETLARAKKETEAGWGACTVEAPPKTFRVLSPDVPSIGYDTIEGMAECARCRSKVGTLEVKVPTMFGLEEDQWVLSGRYGRVY